MLVSFNYKHIALFQTVFNNLGIHMLILKVCLIFDFKKYTSDLFVT